MKTVARLISVFKPKAAIVNLLGIVLIIAGTAMNHFRGFMPQAFLILIPIACILLGANRNRFLRRWLLVFLIIVWAVLLGTIIIRSFISSSYNTLPGIDNDQNYAASIVVLSFLISAFIPHRWWKWFSVFSFLAVLLANSRIALVAMWAGWIMVGIREKNKGLVVTIILQMIVIVSAALLLFSPNSKVNNLLHYSNEFLNSVWYKNEDLVVYKYQSPCANGSEVNSFSNSYKMEINTVEENLLLRQVAEKSIKGLPYIASVYLCSESPIKLLLSDNLGGRAICDIGSQWQRCVAPWSIGDGSTLAQFKIFALQDIPLDFYIWGAQIERAKKSHNVQETEATVTEKLSYTLGLPSYRNHKIIKDIGMRFAIYAQAWKVFIFNALAGVGWGRIRGYFENGDFNSTVLPNHAHNFVLQILAETGIIGFLGWVLFFCSTVIYILKERWRSIIPVIIVIFVLNTFDYTFFTNVVYISFWLLVGLESSHASRKDLET